MHSLAEVDLELKKTILKAIYIQYEHRKYIIKPEITEENLGLIPLGKHEYILTEYA